MVWEKRGLIYCPDGSKEWARQYAMLPTPLCKGDSIRIYLGFCDRDIVGRIGYVDVDRDNPSRVRGISSEPILDVGRPGAFDDNGVVPISILDKGEEIWLYYIGFQKGVRVPYYMFCGLAISRDRGESFCRYSDSPILDRVGDEIFARCGVNVIMDEGKYRMWYIGSHREGWTESGGKLRPLYVMKYTESEDGIHWDRPAIQCMEYANPDEHGFGRPFVWREGRMLKMMYSIRTYSRGYYIGYAESADGAHWRRMDDQAGIGLSESGWDDTNLSYPYRMNVGERTYLFYNGNGCGKSGFGFAELRR